MSEKKLNRRDFIKMTALVASGAILAACKRQPTEAAKPTEAATATAKPIEVVATATPKGKIVLEWMMSEPRDDTTPIGHALNVCMKRYTDLHPNIEFFYNELSREDMRAQIMARAVAGKPPDFAKAGYWTSELASNGSLVDCGPYLATSGWKEDDFWKAIWDITVFKGQQYGIPYTLDTRCWFYNDEMYKKAGVPPPVTWDDVLNVTGPAFRKIDTYVWQPMGSPGDIWAWFTGSCIVYAYGGDYIREENGLCVANCSGTKVEEAIDFERQLLASGVIPASHPSDGGGESIGAYYAGSVASVINGPWAFAELDQAISKGDIKWTPLITQDPKVEVPGTTTGGFSWYIFKTPNMDTSWEFIDWMLQNDQLATGYSESFPPTKQAMVLDIYKDPRYDYFVEAMKYSKWMMPPIAGWEEMSLIVWRNSMEAVTGQITTSEAMQNLDKELQKFLDEGENKFRQA